MVKKAIRDAIGAHSGASVHVEMERDTAARTVVVPDDLQRALADHPEARARYAALAYSHQRAYVDWIVAAKKAETRERRIQRVLERLT